MQDLKTELSTSHLEMLLTFANENIKVGKLQKKDIQDKWLASDFTSAKFKLSCNIDFWKTNGVYSINLMFCETDPYAEYGFGYSIKTEYLIIILALGVTQMIDFIEKHNDNHLNDLENPNMEDVTLKISDLHQVFEDLNNLKRQHDGEKNTSIVYFILNGNLDWNPSFD